MPPLEWDAQILVGRSLYAALETLRLELSREFESITEWGKKPGGLARMNAQGSSPVNRTRGHRRRDAGGNRRFGEILGRELHI